MEKDATISSCGLHRYKLSRIWDNKKPLVLFVMLNPSTADANEDDPTIRRCIGYAKSWGYGGLMVGNLFSFRATDPKELKEKKNDIQDIETICTNHSSLKEMHEVCEITVCAWGNPPIQVFGEPLEGLTNLHYLELTKSGNPKHPLYLKKDLKPIRYEITKINDINF